MGNSKWMSVGARKKGVNLCAAATVGIQQSKGSPKVAWTPIFTRGKLRVYVCDASAASADTQLPEKLNDSQNLAKFIKHILPGILAEMRREYGWSTTPRTVVHDKASYMVTSSHERLHITFAEALTQAGFKSWIGEPHATSKWLVSRLGDLYLHETVISHIRRLLENKFPCLHAHETVAQFRARMDRVVQHMNSNNFGAGGGLPSLARGLRQRCQELVRLNGERLPK